MLTASIIHRWRNDLQGKHLPNGLYGCFHEGAQSLIELNLPPPSRAMMKDCAARDDFSGHFFEAHCLGAELKVVMFPLSAGTVFVFHRIRYLPVKFDDIGLADQTQTAIPKGQRPLDPDPFLNFRSDFIHPIMNRPPPHRVKILIERLLDMNQRALPGAVTVMLQGGDHNGVVWFVTYYWMVHFPQSKTVDDFRRESI